MMMTSSLPEGRFIGCTSPGDEIHNTYPAKKCVVYMAFILGASAEEKWVGAIHILCMQ